jgi:hypothetical protein
MLWPSSLQHGASRMYTGDLIEDLLETVARAGYRSSHRKNGIVIRRTPDPPGQSTARRVPATVSSEPG